MPRVKVAQFFDSKNFSMALQGYDPTAEIDYNWLASWLTSQVSSGKGNLVGCYYYTGYTSPMCGGPADFDDFLDGLEKIGYVVNREPHVNRRGWCKKCNLEYTFRAEKRVDTRLVADMVKLAAADTYDIAVLLSGDQDFVPGVEAAIELGKHVYIATWPRHGVSKALKESCHGQIELGDGLDQFSTGRLRAPRDKSRTLSPSGDPQTNMTREIERALKIHKYLSRGHFINNWRPQLDIPEPGPDREAMLNTLIAEGKVIEDTRERDGWRFKVLNLPPQ